MVVMTEQQQHLLQAEQLLTLTHGQVVVDLLLQQLALPQELTR